MPLELSGKETFRTALVNTAYRVTTSGPLNTSMQFSGKKPVVVLKISLKLLTLHSKGRA